MAPLPQQRGHPATQPAVNSIRVRIRLLWREGAHATLRDLPRSIYPQGTESSQGDSSKATFQGLTHFSVPTISVKDLDDFVFSDLLSHDLAFRASVE